MTMYLDSDVIQIKLYRFIPKAIYLMTNRLGYEDNPHPDNALFTHASTSPSLCPNPDMGTLPTARYLIHSKVGSHLILLKQPRHDFSIDLPRETLMKSLDVMTSIPKTVHDALHEPLD
jgi:hypothetical protein